MKSESDVGKHTAQWENPMPDALAGNDTVPVSVQCGECVCSIGCRTVIDMSENWRQSEMCIVTDDK